MAKTNRDEQNQRYGVVAAVTVVVLNLLGLAYVSILQNANPGMNALPFFIILGIGTVFGIALTVYAYRRRAAVLSRQPDSGDTAA